MAFGPGDLKGSPPEQLELALKALLPVCALILGKERTMAIVHEVFGKPKVEFGR